jgi:hypothetical protein
MPKRPEQEYKGYLVNSTKLGRPGFPEHQITQTTAEGLRRKIITLKTVDNTTLAAAQALCKECTHKLAAENGGGSNTKCTGISNNGSATCRETRVAGWDDTRTRNARQKAKCNAF